MAKTKTVMIRLEGHIFAKWDKWDKEFKFIFFAYDEMSDYLKVAPYCIEIEMPRDIDLHAGQIACLQEKRKLILAENQVKLNLIDDEIQNLLALENNEH